MTMVTEKHSLALVAIAVVAGLAALPAQDTLLIEDVTLADTDRMEGAS